MLFESHFSSVERTTGKNLSKCGKCRRYMKYIPLRPPRMYCVTCEETYKLPDKGKIKAFMEKQCPIDGFGLLLYTTGSGANTIMYPLCPHCYNDPPFEELGKKRRNMLDLN